MGTSQAPTVAQRRSDVCVNGSSRVRDVVTSATGPGERTIAFSAHREDDSTSHTYVMNIAEGGEAARA